MGKLCMASQHHRGAHLHSSLGLCIKGAAVLVQDQQTGIANEGTGEGDPLPLPPTEGRPSLADPRVKSLRELGNEVPRLHLRVPVFDAIGCGRHCQWQARPGGFLVSGQCRWPGRT